MRNKRAPPLHPHHLHHLCSLCHLRHLLYLGLHLHLLFHLCLLGTARRLPILAPFGIQLLRRPARTTLRLETASLPAELRHPPLLDLRRRPSLNFVRARYLCKAGCRLNHRCRAFAYLQLEDHHLRNRPLRTRRSHQQRLHARLSHLPMCRMPYDLIAYLPLHQRRRKLWMDDAILQLDLLYVLLCRVAFLLLE